MIIFTILIVIAVILYHGACWLEYKLGVEDTARVVPVHGMWLVYQQYIKVYSYNRIVSKIWLYMHLLLCQCCDCN